MRKELIVPFLLVILMGSLLVACAPTRFAREYRNEAYSGGAVKSVLIVAVAEELLNRKRYEDTLAKMLKERGVDATPSYAEPLLTRNMTRENILETANRLEVDAILVTQILGIEEKYLHYDSHDYKYQHLKINPYAPSSETYTKMENVRLMTSMYARETQNLIWSAVTETLRPESLKEIIDSQCKAVISGLKAGELL